MTPNSLLLPYPQELTYTGETLILSKNRFIALNTPSPARLLFTARRAQQTLFEHAGFNWQIIGGTAVPADQVGLLIKIDESIEHAQGYRLIIAEGSIHIEAQDEAGAFYGVLTLAQLLRQHGAELPAMTINDWPDMPVRGVMLDISRDKVPTMETLYTLVDMLASWKINEFQLYTEHTFAYRHHPDVWAKASPITAEEILALDAYCRERFIDLVPNQNVFGHMHRWFEHEQYLPLAESDKGCIAWGVKREISFSLNTANPDTLPFIEGLLAELLPNFTSQFFNVNCDETFDLGTDRSKALVEEKGKGRVYLDFLLEIYKLVNACGLTMQYWGDIINKYPDLVPELPKDAIALEWGYEANHDFDGMGALFGQSGVPFYVCPGTSSWNTLAGRTDNAIGNIRNAVENGLKHGATGILNTSWGDRGHWQTFPIDFLGFAYGAAVGWAFEVNVDLDLPDALDNFAFGDEAGVMGKLAYDLGNAYQQPGYLLHNSNLLNQAYFWPLDLMDNQNLNAPDIKRRDNLKEMIADLPGRLRATLDYIDTVMAPLEKARMNRPDADMISNEFGFAADMLRHGARRLLVIVGDDSVSASELETEFAEIEKRYRVQWLARNRPGGLEDSLARMTGARAAHE